MSLKRRAALTLLSCLIFSVAAAQPRSPKSTTLFTINDKPVSSEEFIHLYRKNHRNRPEEFTKKNIEAYLDLFINYKLKVEEALARGMDTTSTFKSEYQTYRKELLKPYLPDSQIIDSLVALTYDRLQEEVEASHILVRLPPEASPADTMEAYEKISRLRMRAVAGEDFSALAAGYSEEPGADKTKGNLGFFTAMQMVFPFEQAAYNTPVGEVSKPIRTKFGYHIIKVSERRPTRGEVEVSHIMIRSQGAADEELAKNTIFDIYDKLRKGMNWEDLCSQYSEDESSREKGGRLRPFGVGGMAAAPEFQEMAFALKKPGDISDPVKTRYGWHIIRLESKIPLPTFEELRPSLTQRVSRDERVAISKEALREKMRAEFGYVEHTASKEKLLDLAETVLRKPLTSIEDTLYNAALITMQGQTFQVKDFLEYVAGQPDARIFDKPAEKLEQLFIAYGEDLQLRLMEERVKRDSPAYEWLLKEYYEGILLFEIMEEEIWNRAMEDTVGKREYFDDHADHYQTGERLNARIYSASAHEPLEALKELIESGDGEIGGFLAEQRIREDSGSFEREDRAVLAGIDWKPGTYLTENKGVHYLISVSEVLPPKAETFEEARSSLISDYQTFLEDSWISELKRKFGVKVRKKAKKRAFAELMHK